MPLETIYIARHGFRQGFDVPKSASRALPLLSLRLTVILSAISATYLSLAGVTGTWRDPVLTALGQQQARELAAYFADNSIPIDLIFSSPY